MFYPLLLAGRKTQENIKNNHIWWLYCVTYWHIFPIKYGWGHSLRLSRIRFTGPCERINTRNVIIWYLEELPIRILFHYFWKYSFKHHYFEQNIWGKMLPPVPLSHNQQKACVPSHVWLFATAWTAASQTRLSIEFSRQEYSSGLPFPSPGINRKFTSNTHLLSKQDYQCIKQNASSTMTFLEQLAFNF